jgi:hypothetical protein
MGSSRRSKSTRARALRPGNVRSPDRRNLLYDVLDRFSQALAIMETVTRALEAAENDHDCSGVGSEIATLRQGIGALRAVHAEFDLAIAKVTP